MPIPAFDGILNVLPPFLGIVDGYVQGMSPYECSVNEFCDRFTTSPVRKRILNGFLDFRLAARELGIRGFHWLGGSFVEDIETQERRDPGDLDVVTFTEIPLDSDSLNASIASKPELSSKDRVKEAYGLDHEWLPLGTPPAKLVEMTRYWYGLYAHRTRDQTWKGMLQIELTDSSDDDDAARLVVEGKP